MHAIEDERYLDEDTALISQNAGNQDITQMRAGISY